MRDDGNTAGQGDSDKSARVPIRRTPSVPPTMTPGWPEGASAPRLPVMQWRNIVVLLERGLSERSDYVYASDLMVDHARRYPRGIGVLSVLASELTMPGEAVRLAMQETYARIGPHTLGIAFCVEATDFRGAALRAAMAGIKLSLRASYPIKIVSELAEAARFITVQSTVGSLAPVDSSELLATIASCRARFAPVPSP